MKTQKEILSMEVLSNAELLNAQRIIDMKPAGVYELKTLYDSDWLNVGSPNTFGKRFKKTVQAGLLQRIILLTPPKTYNHFTYEIIK
jgi:hypothetical protein